MYSYNNKRKRNNNRSVKIMKQRFCLFFVLCVLCSAVFAQSSMISISRDARLNRSVQLGGKAGVLFYSKASDLVISTTVNKDHVVSTPRISGNMYVYEMVLDISTGRDRVFNVSKKGSVISEKTGQVLLKANEYTAFNVDIVDKPIYMELSDEGGHYILHGNGWALIEINSEIRITPNYNPRLKLEHRSSRSMAGVYVDSLIINVEALQSLSARLETVRKELNRLNAEYDNLLAQNTSESVLNRLDRKIKEVETTVSSLSKELDELSYISVKGDGTNERVIDAEEILALKSKDKRKYNVILQSKPHGGSAFARPFVTSQYVLFKVTPQNALVELDGQTLDVADGTATKRMPFGTYSYRVQAPRHAVKSGTIVVNDPNAKHIVNITLEPQYVNAKFSVANNAEIWIDEQKRGTGSCTLELGYGTYLVECRLPGYKSSIQEIQIGRNSATGTIALNPPIPIYGSVDINTTPADAEVWIDGKQVGTTPMLLSECIVGEHKLRISKLGYKDYTGNLTIKEGQTTTSSIALEKDLATIKNSPIVQSDDARIMKFLRGYPNGLRITNDGTAIDSKGSTTFDIKFVDDNHFSVSVYGSTAYSSFSNRRLLMKLSNGSGVVTNDELRRCRYNSFTASFTISGNILTVYLSYTTAAYSSYSLKREYTLKDIEDEEQTPEGAVSPNANVRTFTVNGVSFQMVFVEGGTFRMGSDSGDSDENPVHDVTLSNYSIGKTEVTQALWRAVMGTNPSSFKGDNLPVEKVSWNDCQTFIKKLNAITGANFRLPTEAEWEYAARGGKQSKNYTYSGSNDIGTVAWYYSNSSIKTHPVGQKQPNELGIYDMSGNVLEWCSDWYSSYSRYAQTNPSGATSNGRVRRGGSWYDDAGYCRSTFRGYYAPAEGSVILGFRLALPAL